MKKLTSIDPFILCERVKRQDQILSLILVNQDDKMTTIRKVVNTSPTAKVRGIENGDIVVTRINKFQELPISLTEDDEVPFDTNATLEIVDPALVVAIYKDVPDAG